MSNDDNNNNENNKPGFFIRIQASDMDDIMSNIPPELLTLMNRDMERSGRRTRRPEKEEEIVTPEKIKFDYKMTNCNQDLKTLVQKLKKSKSKQWSMLLYGISGSGKSYFGQYLAQELHMSFIKKKVSDLVDKFVGETERNVAAAFKEAREKKAVLLFDEADSFLFDRKYADREFEATHVNEFLTQMENHPYPIICTSNLKDKIDSASLRRFIFKIKFDFMTKENIQSGLKTYFDKKLKFTKDQLEKLEYVTAGDFKVARKKIDILEDGKYTNKNVFEYILKEQDEKELNKSSNSINF